MGLLSKIGIYFVFFLSVTVPVYSENSVNDDKHLPLLDTDLDQEIKWLQAEAYVFTASKTAERLDLAPSVMTVYTDENIRHQGFRNMNEMLDRTVGFFINRNMSNILISNRGIALNENEPFLLLVDGHNMNSIVDKGPGDYFLFPLLSYAKQVEIIRGPGSTLWGSDASLGVINVITKDGKDINGFETSFDYASEDKYRYTNVLYGNSQNDENDVMFSFTYAESDGFPEEGYTSKELWESIQRGPIDKINDSWEFYGKIRQNDVTFTARASDLMNINMDKTQYWTEDKPEVHDFSDFNDYYNRRRHYMLDMKHVKTFSTAYTLETKLFADLMECWQGLANPNISSGLKYVDEYFSSKESRLGMEMVLKIDHFKNHHLLTGIQGVRSEVDPVFYRVTQTTFTVDPQAVFKDATVLVKPDDEDLNLAAYIEDNWTLMDDLNVILGLRIDHDTLRENSSKILPRGAVIYQFASGWTAKYLFNTGYVRPPVAKSFLSQKPELPDPSGFLVAPHIGVEESEEVATHDIQLIYSHRRFKTSITGYHTIFKNSFNFAGITGYIDDVLHYFMYVNSNEITSNGIEVDARLKVNRFADIYGNYSHVISSKIDKFENTADGIEYSLKDIHLFTDNRTLTKFPHIMWNAGMDVFLLERITLNLHYRGWTDMWSEKLTAPGEYERLGPEHFVDANLCFTNLPGNTTFALYAKNLFDNNATYPLLLTEGWPVRTRSVGAKATMRF